MEENEEALTSPEMIYAKMGAIIPLLGDGFVNRAVAQTSAHTQEVRWTFPVKTKYLFERSWKGKCVCVCVRRGCLAPPAGRQSRRM